MFAVRLADPTTVAVADHWASTDPRIVAINIWPWFGWASPAGYPGVNAGLKVLPKARAKWEAIGRAISSSKQRLLTDDDSADGELRTTLGPAPAPAALRPPGSAGLRKHLSPAERRDFTEQTFAAKAHDYAKLTPDEAAALYEGDRDLVWTDAPGAWHQQLARIVDHRFSTFDELFRFAVDAKRAGAGALMLVEIQKTAECPGSWYGGLQLYAPNPNSSHLLRLTKWANRSLPQV